MKWWKEDTTPAVKEGMRSLISQGVFGIEHGGMVQHDEALSDYKQIIISFDSSLQFLKEEFNLLPKVGMSIDGFGHSSISPYIFRALGHEALVVFRMPWEMYSKFDEDKQYMFTWEGDAESRIRVYRLE
jgi:hypothetical protein